MMHCLDATPRRGHGAGHAGHADFTRIRNVQLGRFTIDRLMTVLNKLGQHVDVQIDVHPRRAADEASPASVKHRGAVLALLAGSVTTTAPPSHSPPRP